MISASTDFDESLLETYTDEDIVHHIHQSPTLTTTRKESIRLLSHNLVSKLVPWPQEHRDEVAAMEMARSVGVIVPAVRRIIQLPSEDYVIVMERVHGQTLEQLWPQLGLWATIRVGWQLRSYISSLRTITVQTSGGLKSGKTRSEWIQGMYGPTLHASPYVFCDYLNWWLVKARPSNCEPLPRLLLSPPREHVLVHQDLAPRNMILDSKSRLWVVDWDRSGFYPPFMEYLGMEGPERAMPWLAARNLTAWWGRVRWSLFCLIACGYSSLHRTGRDALVIVRQRSLRYKLEKPVHSARY